MLCYNMHKEVILRPVPQCITVRYRRDDGLRCPTHDKPQHGPSPEYSTETTDDSGRPSQWKHRHVCGSKNGQNHGKECEGVDFLTELLELVG
jgi:hypothetical protein